MANIATTKLKKSDNSLYDLLGMEEDINAESWEGVPEFVHKHKKAAYSLNIHFRNKEDLEKFAALIEAPQLLVDGKRQKSLWYPPLVEGEKGQNALTVWMDSEDPDVKELLKKGKK